VPGPGERPPGVRSVPLVDPLEWMSYIDESVMISATTDCAKGAQAAHALLHAHDMRNLLSIALCLPLVACVIGDETGIPGGGDDDPGTDPNPNDGSITGLITADATWSGTVLIGLDRTTTRIEPNVTITVAPGTLLQFKPGAGLDIRGSLRVQGTKDQKVRIESANGESTFGLIVGGAPTPGTLELTYAVMTRGNIQTSVGSTATITDSKMYRAAGDLLIMTGGTVNMSYSQIGPDPGQTETTHCNIHTGGTSLINITRSNINGAPYGMMFYGGQNAILTNNNWYTNQIDLSTEPGVSGDITGGWFEKGAPTIGGGATITGLNALAAARLVDAGVR
jgi:hypothetical protein